MRDQKHRHAPGGLQAVLEIARQDEKSGRQHVQLAIGILLFPQRDVSDLLNQLLGQQVNAAQLQEIQGAADLLDAIDTVLEELSVIAIGGKLLQSDGGLLNGGDQLILNQFQGIEVDVFSAAHCRYLFLS